MTDLTASQFQYELLFVLTPSGSMSYEGTTKFMDHLQANIKDRLHLAICLDSLSADSIDTLYVHKSSGSRGGEASVVSDDEGGSI